MTLNDPCYVGAKVQNAEYIIKLFYRNLVCSFDGTEKWHKGANIKYVPAIYDKI